jgi:hypothetical protein
MNRPTFALVAFAIGAAATTAAADPKSPAAPIQVPAVGSSLDLQGPGWPNLDWLYDGPSLKDAAGKVVVHWFCAPKIAACADDLARMISLRDGGRVYIIAYINGNKADAKKLDPIRESEGVGRGTVGYNRGAGTLMKQLGFTGPASIVVGADGKVALVSTGGSADVLDARDKLVTSLVGNIKDFTVAKNGPAATIKAGDTFKLELVVSLASWLKYSNSPEAPTMTIMVPKDIKCDATTFTGDKLAIVNQTLTGTAHCTAPRGSYEARAEIRFGYDSISGGNGLGTDSGDWKFTVTP